MKYFMDETHKNNVMKFIRDKRLIYPDGQVHCYYLPALFILLSTKNNLCKKTRNYIDADGIDFEAMMEKQDFSSGEAKLVRLAANLYNGSLEVTPEELINTLDDRNYDLAMQAIRFKRYGCHIENLLDMEMDMEAGIEMDIETDIAMKNDFQMEL